MYKLCDLSNLQNKEGKLIELVHQLLDGEAHLVFIHCIDVSIVIMPIDDVNIILVLDSRYVVCSIESEKNSQELQPSRLPQPPVNQNDCYCQQKSATATCALCI